LGGGQYGSCLNLAISKVQYFLIRDLIAFHCDVKQKDHIGNGPLHYLVPVFKKNVMEAIKIAYLLLEAGIAYRITNIIGAEPNLSNDSGYTPLQLAVKKSVLCGIKFFI
jgi:ankyrin repeat protein